MSLYMELPVKLFRRTSSLVLPEMMLVAAGVVPPIVSSLLPLKSMPNVFPRATLPLTSVPMKFPWMRRAAAPEIQQDALGVIGDRQPLHSDIVGDHIQPKPSVELERPIEVNHEDRVVASRLRVGTGTRLAIAIDQDRMG